MTKVTENIERQVVESYQNEKLSFVKLAKKYNLSVAKVRKILISSGNYETNTSRLIKELLDKRKTIPEISEITKLSKTAINNNIPYRKGLYGKSNNTPSINNTRVRRHRENKAMKDYSQHDYPKTKDHVVFFSRNDMSTGFYMDSVKDYLLHTHVINTLEEAIHAYNCYLFISNGIIGKNWNQEEIDKIKKNANKIKSHVVKYLLHNPSVVLDGFLTLDFMYQRSILKMSVLFTIYKQWKKQSFRDILNEKTIFIILESEKIVDFFSDELSDYLKKHLITAATILIDNTQYQFSEKEQTKFYLPKSFKDEDKALAISEYIKEKDIHREILMLFPYRVTRYVTEDVIALEKKKIDQNIKKRTKEKSNGLSISIGAKFVKKEDINRDKLKNSNEFIVEYPIEDIDANLDFKGIYTYLYRKFGFFDLQNGMVELAKKNKNLSLTDHLLGGNNKGCYNMKLHQNSLATLTIGTLLLYYRYLKNKNVFLEDFLGKDFSIFINTIYKVDNFNMTLSNDHTSYYDKCKSIAPMIENLYRQIYLVGKGKEIDKYNLSSCPKFDFGNLQSLVNNKYLYITTNNEKKVLVESLMYLMFSNQHVFYVKKTQPKDDSKTRSIESNFELLLLNNIVREEVPDYDLPKLDYMIENKCITIHNNCLKPTKMVLALRELWDFDCIAAYRSSCDPAIIHKLITDGWLEAESTLLSRPEQNLLSFIHNNKYPDAWALRNYYSHGELSDLPEEQHEINYIWFLYIILVLEMKLAEDLDLAKTISEPRLPQ